MDISIKIILIASIVVVVMCIITYLITKKIIIEEDNERKKEAIDALAQCSADLIINKKDCDALVDAQTKKCDSTLKYNLDVQKKEFDDAQELLYNNIASSNPSLTSAVTDPKNKNYSKYKNYARCIGNISKDGYNRQYLNDDAGANASRHFYCTPYYTNGSVYDTSKDYRKPAFKK